MSYIVSTGAKTITANNRRMMMMKMMMMKIMIILIVIDIKMRIKKITCIFSSRMIFLSIISLILLLL